MPVDVSGKQFFMATEVAEIVGVTRQTLWRWHKAQKIPSGRRYRGTKLLFTQEEVETIYEYAHRLEPGDPSADFENQLKLFEETGA
jgi:predicted site-specific integrase-resolvase